MSLVVLLIIGLLPLLTNEGPGYIHDS